MSYWSGKKVLITGGAGFIGSNLAKNLVKEGCDLRIVDNLERGKLYHIQSIIDSVQFINIDIRDSNACNDICKDVDIVFHLASKVGGIGYYLEKPGEVILDNIKMDSNILLSSLLWQFFLLFLL